MPNKDVHNTHTGSGDNVTGDKHVTYNYLQSSEKETPPFPRFHNTSATPLPHAILGRDSDLEAVHQKLLIQKQCLVLNGLGGIGKSSLAKLYIQQYHAKYQHIIWLYEKATPTDILLDDSSLQTKLGIRDAVLQCIQAQDTKAAINTIIQALNELPNPVLLVADNVTDLHAFSNLVKHLDKSKYNVLFTSRNETNDFPFHKIKKLDKETALSVFVLHYNGENHVSETAELALRNDAALGLILEKIDYHTLTIELYAKLLRKRSDLCPAGFLTLLEKHLLVPQISYKIGTDYKAEKASVLNFILAAFDIGGLSTNQEALHLLAEWALLPPNPILTAYLYPLFGIEEKNKHSFYDALLFLIENAWIQQGKEIENTYACHALIQEAVRWQLKEVEKDYTPLIERVSWLLYTEAGGNPLEKEIWLPYATSVLSKLTQETEAFATLSNNTAEIYRAIGDFSKSLEYGLKDIAIREKIFFPEHPSLATSYNNIGGTYQFMGDFTKSLEYGLKSMKIFEKVFSFEHPDLATSYNNIAEIYRAMGDFSKSLKYGLKSIEIREKILSPEHPDLALSYNNIGGTYQAMGDLPKSLAYGLKSIEIFEKILSPEHPDLAVLYGNIALIYQAIGNFPKSLEYRLKDFAIHEKILSPEHPRLAASYSNLALIYQIMGNLTKSLEYGLKSMEIKEKVLSPEHPDLALSYINIGGTYQAMEDFFKSLEYGLKGMKIFEKILSPEHPDLATSYNNIAETYRAMGDLPKSLEYGLKSLAIREKIFSPEHPDLAGSYNNIAIIYYYLQDRIPSLAYFQQAIQIWKKSLPSGHPHTKTAIDSMAFVLQAAVDAGQGEAVAGYKAWYEKEVGEDAV